MMQYHPSSVCLVVGLSGVGKSTMISSASMGNFRVISASALLKEAKQRLDNQVLSSEDLRQGQVFDNQSILLNAFNEVLALENKPIIVDAHNIIDTDNGVIDIPFEVLSGFFPRVIVLIYDDIESLRSRRILDKTRDRPDRSARELSDQQERAIENAKAFAKERLIPYIMIKSGDIDAMKTVLMNLI